MISLRRCGPMLGCLLIVVCPFSHSQSEFDKANSLLRELDEQQKQPPAKINRELPSKLFNSVPAQAERLINEGVVTLLNKAGPHSSAELRRKLTTALQVGSPTEYQPEAYVFSSDRDHQPPYLIAYNIPYCAACGRSWIGVIGFLDGKYQVLARAEKPFPNQNLTVTLLGKWSLEKVQFLEYGTHWGDAHSRLNAAVYVFEGGKLHVIWSRIDLPQGNLKVTSQEIRISFLTSLRPPWLERTEVYEIHGEKIQLRKSFERPIN